jgi:hypothetical protein
MRHTVTDQQQESIETDSRVCYALRHASIVHICAEIVLQKAERYETAVPDKIKLSVSAVEIRRFISHCHSQYICLSSTVSEQKQFRD